METCQIWNFFVSRVSLKLQHLQIVIFTGLISINAWPKLRSIDLWLPDLSESQLSTILCASPHVTYVAVLLTQRSLSHAMLLAMILHYCPAVKRIILATVATNETVKDAQSAFKRYPTPPDALKHLVAFASPSLHQADRVTHYLLQHLSTSPVLQYVSLNAAGNSIFALSMTRCLTKLKCLHQLGEDNQDGNVRSIIKQLSDVEIEKCFKFRLGPQLSTPLENMRYMCHNSVISFAENYDDVIAEAYDMVDLYPEFNSEEDRERFYDLLYQRLSDTEKANLVAWDKGEYGIASGKKR